MDYELRQADKKLEHFAEFCEDQKLKPQECIVVGDGENDLGLFKLSGKGILYSATNMPMNTGNMHGRLPPTFASLSESSSSSL